MNRRCEEQTWREWWALIYHFVGLNEQLRDTRIPVHRNFWGTRRLGGKQIITPEQVLKLGPHPTKDSISQVLGYGSGDTDTWLRRRARRIDDAIAKILCPS